MHRLFYLTVPFLYLLSLLPFRVLYGISNVLYLLIYKVLGYRTQVVRKNLRIAFPELSKNEMDQIEKDFYHHFFDLWVEGVKFFTISPRELLKRCSFEATEIFDKYYAKKQPVLVVMGHGGNWEWSSATMSLSSKFTLQALFQPVKNPTANALLKKSRSRFGALLIERKKALRHLLSTKNELAATTFLTDQSPYQLEKATWVDFFNTKTPFFNGFAPIAQKLNYPVIFVHVFKVGRGKYQIRTETISEIPSEGSIDEMIGKFASFLETAIGEQPFNWLWTHNRWKRAHRYSEFQ